jgi:hypothetical protein
MFSWNLPKVIWIDTMTDVGFGKAGALQLLGDR